MASAAAVARLSGIAGLLVALMIATAAPVAAAGTEYDRVLATAKNQLGDRWVHYAKGPNTFDCVGFVWYVYHENGLQDKIGGYRGVKAYYNWFKERGLVGTGNGMPGDLIIWGNFQHIGMNLGGGKAISALVNPHGVSIHDIKGYLGIRFRFFLHTHLAQ
jgi:peptidoglycan DL-endopeptidase CwlO